MLFFIIKIFFFSLKNGGHILSLSFSSGVFPNIDLLELHRLNATVSGIWLGGCEPLKIVHNINLVLEMFDSGYLQGLKINTFSLANIQQCIDSMQSSEFFGKAVINMY